MKRRLTFILTVLTSDDGKRFQTLGKMDFRYVSTEVIGGFTGVMLGVFAQCTSTDNMYADFDCFDN